MAFDLFDQLGKNRLNGLAIPCLVHLTGMTAQQGFPFYQPGFK
jgi:hypothetical protein